MLASPAQRTSTDLSLDELTLRSPPTRFVLSLQDVADPTCADRPSSTSNLGRRVHPLQYASRNHRVVPRACPLLRRDQERRGILMRQTSTVLRSCPFFLHPPLDKHFRCSLRLSCGSSVPHSISFVLSFLMCSNREFLLLLDAFKSPCGPYVRLDDSSIARQLAPAVPHLSSSPSSRHYLAESTADGTETGCLVCYHDRRGAADRPLPQARRAPPLPPDSSLAR